MSETKKQAKIIADVTAVLRTLAESSDAAREVILRHNLCDLKELKKMVQMKPIIPSLNLSASNTIDLGGLKPICEMYNADESATDSDEEPTFNLGVPTSMSKTFDNSSSMHKVVPKLDFTKLKHVKEQKEKDWYGY